MATRRRSPSQTLFTLLILLMGIWVGIGIVRGQFAVTAIAQEEDHLPDLTLVSASPEELVDVGFAPENEAPPWSDISIRLKVLPSGDFVQVISCIIAPEDLGAILDMPTTARRPLGDGPPEHWPWDRDNPDSVLRVPPWYEAKGRHAQLQTLTVDGSAWKGLFASYEPSSQRLAFWQWRRSDWQPPIIDWPTDRVVDELAQTLGAQLIAQRHPPTPNGWLHMPGWEAKATGLPDEVNPPGASRYDLLFRPDPDNTGRIDYLLAIGGVEADVAEALLRDRPPHPRPDDEAPPTEAWAEVMPPKSDGGLPLWFNPGPGPRWAHCLIDLATGRVRAGRWAAYDPARKTLYIWDWERSEPQAKVADLNAGEAPVHRGDAEGAEVHRED